MVDFFQYIIIILGIYGTFVCIHGHLHPIFGEMWCSLCFLERYLLHVWYSRSISVSDICHSLTMTVCLSSVLDQCEMLNLCSVFNYYAYELFVIFVCRNTSTFHFFSFLWNCNAMAYTHVSSDAHCLPSHPNVPRWNHWGKIVFSPLSVLCLYGYICHHVVSLLW